MVKLNFKTPAKEQPITLDVDLSKVRTVEQLKQQVANSANSSVPNIKLIHKGKILKDQTPLETLKLSQGQTFHAVIKQEGKANEPSPSPSTSTNNNNTTTDNSGAGLGGLGGFGGLGGGMGGFGGMPGMGGMGGLGGMGGMGMDPQAMANMMDMVTPEMMQQMMDSNPMLKAMADSNPQVKAMISNPQMMKEMIRNMNPAMMQQAMSQAQSMGLGGMGGMGGLGGMGGMGGMGGFGGLGGLGGFGGPGAGLGATGGANVDYKTLYANQLSQLAGMGFTNEAVNIDALKNTGGNVEAAVQRLLNMLG